MRLIEADDLINNLVNACNDDQSKFFPVWIEKQIDAQPTIDADDLLKEQEHEVCENCPYKLEDIGDFSDGYHTFNDLYYQRCVLFATIVNMNKSKAWKTRCHEDGEPCFGGGWFLVTVETPEGAYGYHYEDKYWNMFDCEELPKAKRWDGYTDKDVGRLLTLKPTQTNAKNNALDVR